MMVGSSDVVAWTEKGAPETNYEPKKTDDWGIWRAHPMGPFTWHPVRSAARRLFTAWWRALRKPVKHSDDVGKSVRKKRLMRQAGELIHELPNPAPMLDLYRKYLTELVRLSKKRAKRVLVVRTPWFDREPTEREEAAFWNLGLGKPGEEKVDRYLSFATARKLLEEMDRVTLEVAESEGAEHVDVRSQIEFSLETFYDEFHLTPKGCEIMGAIVANAILKGAQGELPKPAQDSESAAERSDQPARRRRAQA